MPLFDERDEALVKAFLFNKIESECDADPGIMADYILVTLQNDMTESELKQHCKTDLVEFFGDKTAPFVDTLFESLATKQYLPQQQQQQQQQKDGAVVAGSSASSARPSVEIRGASARAARDDSSSRHHHPYQRDRDSSSASTRRRSSRSRSPAGISSRLSHRDHRRRPSRSPSREERRPREPRAFDPSILNGPLEPGKAQQPTPQQQMMMFQQQQQQMIHQQQQQLHRKRKPCFEFLRKGSCQRGEACTFAHVTGDQAQAMGMQVPQNLMNPAAIASSNNNGGPMQFGMARAPMQPAFFSPLQQPGGGGAFASMRPQQQQQQQPNGRPQAGGSHHQNQYQQQQHSATAVFVTNIPDDSLNDEAVAAFFGKFGAIRDTRIDYAKHSAVVDFADNGAQLQALGTPEAVFNNRFVRVHKAWAHPPGGDASTTAAGGSGNQQPSNQQQQQQPPVWKPKSVAIKRAEMIEKYVDQQKELMKKLTTIKDMPPATRKIIMDSINQIQTKVDEIRRPHKPDSSAAPSSSANPASTAAAAAANGGGSSVSENKALQNKLQALPQEAQRLGMNSSSSSSSGGFAPSAPQEPTGAYNPPAATTAALRSSMSLDKRPRTLVLRNVAPETAERLDSGLAQFGQIESIAKLGEGDPGASSNSPLAYAVRFRARWEAENALKAVASLDGFASVTADWETQ
ncbi:hypothetical protein GGH99_000273 [Coemansia sp. RSA 1285]|nr:hypothetical protein GGH99_000273 [Coemansia sp. RSA 1285]